MKIMQINCVYNTGSTGKIVHDIHTSLKEKGYDSVVCYGRGKKVCEENVYKTSGEFEAKLNNLLSRVTGIPYGGCWFSTARIISIIKKENPDVIHLHCINGFFVNIYRLVRFLKKHKFPTVVTHHAEFLYTANCGYSYECERWQKGCGNCPSPKKAVNSIFFDFTHKSFKLMKKAFSGFERIVSVGVSPWVESRAELSPIFSEFENTAVLNGIDTDIFKPSGDADALKQKLGILSDQKVIVHVTASFSSGSKGGHYIKELAKRLASNVKIVVIGNRDLPEDLPENIIAIGRVENQRELAEYYSMADLCVLASKRETFSMPVAESLCCGTYVAGFKAGGPESIAIPEYSTFVENSNMDELCSAVKNALSQSYDKKEVSNAAIKKYRKMEMADGYIQIYNRV